MKERLKSVICAVFGTLTASVAVTGILTSCNNTPSKTAVSEPVVIASEPVTESATESATETPTAKPTEDPAIVPTKAVPTEPAVNELIYDENNVKIYFRGWNGLNLNFYTEHEDLGYDCFPCFVVSSINGKSFECEQLAYFQRYYYEKGFIIPLPVEQLQEEEFTRVDEIQFKIEFRKGPEGKEFYFESGPITLTR